nr:unnamed protein product [Spirometra erinaceieuropaei]
MFFSEGSIQRKFEALNKSRSPGPDEIPPKLLKELSSGLSVPLPMLFQPSFNNVTLPIDWKLVLSFDGYFQETVNERRDEVYRVRQCKVLFYLEDDGIQVIEPRIRNSGLPQGTLVKRHRIAKPPPNDHLFYTVHDFNVGIDLELYGRKIRLVACDKFTENFLRKMGVRVNEPEPIPEDPYTSLRLGISESMQPKRPYEPIDKLRKFLDHDRHVLRFNCFWDDTESLYGDAREMILHYFLGESSKGWPLPNA